MLRKWRTGHTVAAIAVGAISLFAWQTIAAKRSNAKRS